MKKPDKVIDPWIVDIKGGPGCHGYEISVLRYSNRHGQESYGWAGADKHIISSDGGPCNYDVSPLIWEKLIRLAKEVAEEMNEEENSKQ